MTELCTKARNSLRTRPLHAVSGSKTRQGETMFVMQDAMGDEDMTSRHSDNQHALMTFQRQESWMQATRIVLLAKS